MNKKVICLGNINLDLIMKKSGPRKGAPLFQARLGGSTTNTAVLLRALGVPVAFVSAASPDFLGSSLIALLRNKKIDTSRVLREKTFKTPLAFASIDRKGDSSYAFYDPVCPHFASAASLLPDELLRNARVFHIGSFFSYADATHELVLECVKKAKRRGLLVTYDPNWRKNRIGDTKTAQKRIRAILPYVDILKLSEHDALGMTGQRSLDKAIGGINSIFRGEMFVTRGEKGSFCLNGKEKISCPAFKVKVVDTIGAGDAFTAGLIYRYLSHGKEVFLKEKKEDLVFASAVSALVCTHEGATDGLKNIKQVRDFLACRCYLPLL